MVLIEVKIVMILIMKNIKTCCFRLLSLLIFPLALFKAVVGQFGYVRRWSNCNFARLNFFAKALNYGKFFQAFLMLVLLSCGQYCLAQDGNAGIQEATNKVKGYFDTGCDLMYAIGAVVGIIGAIKVFNKWNAGEPDTNKVAAAWFGSCIFLVVVATVLKSFFGI